MSVRKRVWEGGSAWVVDYIDQFGRRRNKQFDRKKDADRFEAHAKGEVRAGVHTSDSTSPTVAAAAAEWLVSGREDGLEPTTLAQRDQHVRLHILPFLGSAKLSQLTVPRVRQFESDLLAGGRSAAMVRKVRVSLSGILADAQGRGRVARNVVREAPARRKPTDRHTRRLEAGRDLPLPSEVRAIVAALDGPYRALVLVALFAGLRVSELRGLDWKDVDLDSARLTVRQRANLKGALGSPKSAAGRRTVPLPALVVNALRERKLGTGGVGLVFGTATGAPDSTHCVVRNGWWPAQVAAGVTVPVLGDDGRPKLNEDGRPAVAAKYPGIHAARHWFASWCINPPAAGGLGLDAKVVQERLGHSTIGVTLDTYGHLFPRRDDAEALAAGVEALLRG
jgi:integrase